MKKKTIALVMAMVMLFGIAVGGTIAWLTDKTAEVKNTFTVGNINITLDEKDVDDSTPNADRDIANVYQMIPGTTYEKDPTVTVVADSEDCYLFVKFEEENSPAEYLTYTSKLNAENGWTQGDGTDIPANVWYREVTKADTDTVFTLLAGNNDYANGCITVKDSVTNANMNDAAKAELVYTAYAIQKANFATAALAWAEVSK